MSPEARRLISAGLPKAQRLKRLKKVRWAQESEHVLRAAVGPPLHVKSWPEPRSRAQSIVDDLLGLIR